MSDFPTSFPDFWTDAMIASYRLQWQAREAAGLENPQPWWITNPEWADTGTTIVEVPPTDDTSPTGDTGIDDQVTTGTGAGCSLYAITLIFLFGAAAWTLIGR